MELVEVRDLDGPNLFLLEPAIKVEFRVSPDDATDQRISRLRTIFQVAPPADIGSNVQLVSLALMLCEAVRRIHANVGLPVPSVDWQPLETPNRSALVFGWSHRRAAMRIARIIAAVATGTGDPPLGYEDELVQLAASTAPDDRPLMVRDADRRIPIVGVTGTNGKTTTTRLIAHILRNAGLVAGWSSSSGVYINGDLVLDGDYTGPAGARRVLDDETVDVAVLETARGGILLRGIAYESNDVGIFTNVSPDHLDLQGIRTVEGLTKVKSTVVRVTRPTGYAVLNADDALVRSVAQDVRARVFFVSQDPQNTTVDAHVQAGGFALIARDQRVWLWQHGHATKLIDVADIPITYGGRARHMVENALCAAAAGIGLGRSEEEVRSGLVSFKNDATHNLGRLNLFDVDGVRVIVDFAHNEVGLRYLLSLANDVKGTNGRIISIIGTAGDRTDEALVGIGRLAGTASDRVFIKETKKYLRGRLSNDELNSFYVKGLNAAASAPWSIERDEIAALEAALAEAEPDDVVVLMCLEHIPDIQQILDERGRPV
ncbi:MAG: Mur ligase family protein [Thermomicrobiales bacterium]